MLQRRRPGGRAAGPWARPGQGRPPKRERVFVPAHNTRSQFPRGSARRAAQSSAAQCIGNESRASQSSLRYPRPCNKGVSVRQLLHRYPFVPRTRRSSRFRVCASSSSKFPIVAVFKKTCYSPTSGLLFYKLSFRPLHRSSGPPRYTTRVRTRHRGVGRQVKGWQGPGHALRSGRAAEPPSRVGPGLTTSGRPATQRATR